jgi:hypothetical protein
MHVALQSGQHRLGVQRVGRTDIDRLNTSLQKRLDAREGPSLTQPR